MFNSSCPLNYAEIFTVHMLLRILLLSVPEKSLGFCRLPSYRISGLLSHAKVMLTSGNSVQDPMDIFQQCKFSHSPILLSPHNLCGVPLQVFVQMHNALNLKLKNNLAHYRAVAARRRQCAAGSCVGKGRETAAAF